MDLGRTQEGRRGLRLPWLRIVGRRLNALIVIAGLLLAAGLLPAGARTVATSADFEGVVELFTSQGCASCPPADRLLSRFAKQEGVIALSYHVDYWDYIGWKDSMATRQNTERQRAYGKTFRSGPIYTPQMVVNGASEVVGSRRHDVRNALRDSKLTRNNADGEVRLTLDDKVLHVFADAKAGRRAGQLEPVLILVTFRGETVTTVARGENEGRRLVNSNSVLDWRVVGTVSDKPVEVDMPISMLADPEGGKTGCAAFLQTVREDGAPGPIIAAAMLQLEE